MRRPHACDQAPIPIPILGIRSLTNRTVKRNITSALNIISVMCKKRSKRARKYLQTGCTTYRPDLSLCRMFLDVYFISSKFGLLNVNGFSLTKFFSLNASLKFFNINLMLLNTNFKLVNIQISC